MTRGNSRYVILITGLCPFNDNLVKICINILLIIIASDSIYTTIKTADEFRNVSVAEVCVAGWACSRYA